MADTRLWRGPLSVAWPWVVASSLLSVPAWSQGSQASQDSQGSQGSVASPTASSVASSVVQSVKPAAADGRFLAEYGPVTNEDYVRYEEVLRADRVLENVTASLTRSLRLPQDITVRVEECGSSDADWDPVTRHVRLCYELLQAVLELSVAAAGEDDEALAERWFSGMTTFIVFHELGHALVDVLPLRTTLAPEVAADQFALVALGSAVGQPQEVLGALEFLRHAVGNDVAEGLGFLENHGYDRVRVDRLACGFAGALPATQPWLEQLRLLPSAGAVHCGEEFAALDQQWDQWLAPWLRTPTVPVRGRQSSVPGLARSRLTP